MFGSIYFLFYRSVTKHQLLVSITSFCAISAFLLLYPSFCFLCVYLADIFLLLISVMKAIGKSSFLMSVGSQSNSLAMPAFALAPFGFCSSGRKATLPSEL